MSTFPVTQRLKHALNCQQSEFRMLRSTDLRKAGGAKQPDAALRPYRWDRGNLRVPWHRLCIFSTCVISPILHIMQCRLSGVWSAYHLLCLTKSWRKNIPESVSLRARKRSRLGNKSVRPWAVEMSGLYLARLNTQPKYHEVFVIYHPVQKCVGQGQVEGQVEDLTRNLTLQAE